MKRLLIFALGLALFSSSCHRSRTPSQAAEETSPSEAASNGSATISASPNPVLHGPKLGQTTITWDTGSQHSGEVYVSTNGGAEQLFASGQSGTKTANWVQAGSHYEFRLYEGSAHSKLLAKVQVTHQH